VDFIAVPVPLSKPVDLCFCAFGQKYRNKKAGRSTGFLFLSFFPPKKG
jgi:hypothetical protein